jgi:hypothetical protein
LCLVDPFLDVLDEFFVRAVDVLRVANMMAEPSEASDAKAFGVRPDFWRREPGRLVSVQNEFSSLLTDVE